MGTFVISKKDISFITKQIIEEIKNLSKDALFCQYLTQLFKEQFWHYLKNKPLEIKMATALMLDEMCTNGIFYGCKNMPFRFSGCGGVLSFNIPDSFEKLSGNEFIGLPSLKSINVQNNKYFSSLDGVLFDKTLKRLIAFPASKQSNTFVIPNTVTSIDRFSFYKNLFLKKIVLSENLNCIDDEFNTCKSLEEIDVPINNLFFSSKDSVLFDKKQKILYKYPIKKLENEFTVPDTTRTIYKYSFAENEYVKKIILNKKLKKIGMHAFSGCSALRSIDLPDSLTSISRSAFLGNKSLVSIKIPGSIKEINVNTFEGCESLKNLTISEGIERISFEAFKCCSSLVGLKLPQSIESIEGYAFYKCSSLEEVFVPEGIKQIVGSAFADCKMLKSIIFGGTKEQWSKVHISQKSINYKNNIKFIKCIDGRICV